MAKFTALYELLGVPPGASAADIKKAYRRLAVATHPDRCSAKDATERFQKLQVRRRGRAAGALGVLRGTLVGCLRGRAARGGRRGSQASLLEGKCGNLLKEACSFGGKARLMPLPLPCACR